MPYANPEDKIKNREKYKSKNIDIIRKKDCLRFYRDRGKRLQAIKDWQAKNRKRRPWISSFICTRRRAKKLGVKYELTLKWADSVYTGVCSLTGLPFVVGKVNPYTHTIDRVIPADGYTPNNCRFVLFAVNAMKGNGSDVDVIKIAKALVKNK